MNPVSNPRPSVIGLLLLSLGTALSAVSCASTPARAPATVEKEIPSARRVLTADYLPPDDISQIKVAFFDADSTLRVSKSGSVSANAIDDVKLLPYMAANLRALADRGYLIYIVSNQGGVAAGVVTLATADGALRQTVRLIRESGGVVHGYDFAEDDVLRKPKGGMKDQLTELLREKYGPSAKIDLSGSFMVGDSAYKKGVDFDPMRGLPGEHFSNADRKFAETIGVAFYEPADFFGWREYGMHIFTKAEEVDAFVANCRSNPDCSRKLNLANCLNILKVR